MKSQRVNSNAGRDNEKVLAEFAYQPAAEGRRQNGEAKSGSTAEVMQTCSYIRSHHASVCSPMLSTYGLGPLQACAKKHSTS